MRVPLTRGEDGVLEPRLTLGAVTVRGALYGLVLLVLTVSWAFLTQEHDTRVDILAVGTFLGLIGGGVVLLCGLFFWLCSFGDVRRWRDIPSMRNQHDAVAVIGPAFARVGVLLLVPTPACYGLGELVASAPYGSWVYGRA
ncbi:DUF6336 family protein [Yinghuangia sp. YIM S09857]|uniref:DUF6336 family protein n=1 Tax=Yinghuangia sp. YIM S09857 TaxID=3436929 RepID=UPI003F53CFF0